MTEMLVRLLRGDPAAWADAAGAPGGPLLDAAASHGVHVLLAERAPDATRIGPAWRQALDDAMHEAIATDLATRAELVHVLHALTASGVSHVLFKGAALARTQYALPAARPHLDADVLVPAHQVDAATAVLESLAYERPLRIPGELTRSQAPFLKRDGHGVTHTIDLHWKISKPQVFANLFPFDELAAAAVAVPGLGGAARAPDRVHALAIACVHRVAHHHGDDRDKLIWLYDIHLLAGTLNASEAAAFVGLAERKRIAAICASGLSRAQACFDTEVPAGVLDALHRAAERQRHEPTARYLQPRMRRVDVLLSDLAALPTWRTRLRLLGEHVLPPAAYMRGAYGTPGRAVLPLLYAWRVLHGVGGWFRGGRA